MHKRTKRMTLAKETLRHLAESELAGAAGGTYPNTELPNNCATASCCFICAAPEAKQEGKRGRRGRKGAANFIHTR